ncbi:hypothetical protein D9M71_305280 [compost metagenome]
MQIGRHFPHLIEEYRALVGQFQQAELAAPLCAGEGAGGVAEQLAFSEAFRQCRAVQGQEGRVVTRADGMAGTGHQLLAGAGFTLDQQWRIQCRDPLRAGLERADRRRFAEQRIKAFGMVVMQCRQAFADAIGLIQGEQGAGVGDRHRVEEQGLAAETDLVHRQAEMMGDQGALQVGIVEQGGQRFTGRFAAAQGDQRRVGQQHMTTVIHRQHRVGTGGQQGVQLQAPALPRKDVDQGHGLHAAHIKQGFAQLFEHLGAEGRRIDVDVGRDHLHGVQVETASTEQGQHFLGDADAVDEGDVDAHDGPARLANRISMPGKI